MDLYKRVSYKLSKLLTLEYSSSFGMSSKLFDASIRDDIYAVYGLVRIADEIVDTYIGEGQRELLDDLESETYVAMKRGYSTNPIVHSFALTATRYGIEQHLVAAFFTSMRMDLEPIVYDEAQYKTYIYGSAEVVGLMCLRVFCKNDAKLYEQLRPSAQALGAAYQKVNFLRDITSDNDERGRMYFPGATYESFDELAKQAVVTDIKNDFANALPGLHALPKSAKAAVMLSATYYQKVLNKLDAAPVNEIKVSRIRVNGAYKLWLLVKVYVQCKVLS